MSALYIPQDTDSVRADSSFTVFALRRPNAPSPDDCRRYLEVQGTELLSQKEGQRKGDVTQFSIAGHDFVRGDFAYRHGSSHGALVCTPVKDYLLLWNITGWSTQAIEMTVSTLNSITPAKPAEPQLTAPSSESSKGPTQLAQEVSAGGLIKKVAPVYPPESRSAHIQGTVRLSVIINRNGDVVDVEVMEGPIEFAVSAVNAVRKWKFRPYLLVGNPIEVRTDITVNYTLSGR